MLAAIFLGLIFVGCGMLMEDLGARIEEGLDKWNKGSTHGTDWDRFLSKSVEKKCPIAMRYLRTVLVRMKFELGMIAAILVGLPGMIWINNSVHLVSDDSLFWFLAFVCGLLIFLFFEAQASSNLLARVRRIVCGLKPDIARPTYKHKKLRWFFSGVAAWTVLLMFFIGSMWVGGQLEPITPGVVATTPKPASPPAPSSPYQYQAERLCLPEFNQHLESVVGDHRTIDKPLPDPSENSKSL